MKTKNLMDDFAVMVLTHGRPGNVRTIGALSRAGYTGRVVLVVDDEDATISRYLETYGDMVEVFEKAKVAAATDIGDNLSGLSTSCIPRNAMHEVATRIGVKYFVQLDDDYVDFRARREKGGQLIGCRVNLDDAFRALLEFYLSFPFASVAFAQGGDFIGGARNNPCSTRRKAMNSFFCRADKPLVFRGRLNEDVNTYVELGRRGELFLTYMGLQLVQMQTQANSGGMTETYLSTGTYVKSFYTVMYAPSCVKVGVMGDSRSGAYRMHHVIDWRRAVPKILREKHSR